MIILHINSKIIYTFDVHKFFKNMEKKKTTSYIPLNTSDIAKAIKAELLSEYVEQLPVGLFLNDANSQQTVWMNQTAADIMGFGKDRRNHINYELGRQYCHPDDLEMLGVAMNKLLTSDEAVEFMIQVQHENGKWKWMQVFIKVFKRNADGTPYLISGALNDMTHPSTQEPRLKDVLSENQKLRQQLFICKLSKREKEVMQHIVKGLTDNKIADALFVAVHTVRTHRKNIYRKLEVNSVAALVSLVVANGFA